VVEAGNGEEGLAILRSGIPVHLLISDISMPGSIDGILLAKLAKRDYGLPVILVSALDRVAVPVGIADAFFEKPYDLNRIFAMATELLDDGKQ
jgi:DNA-binding NtrC family response regulator